MLARDWQRRIELWLDTMATLFYRPLGTLDMEAFFTHDQLTVDEARHGPFTPVPAETPWGGKWQYGWFKTTVRLPAEAEGERIAFRSGAGAECAIYVDGRAAGAWDRHHKEITLCQRAVPGTCYPIMIEAYAGHGPTSVTGGPVPHGAVKIPECPDRQTQTTASTFGIWNEEIFQLWMDAQTLWSMREALPESSLRHQMIERGLCDMTVAVDLELPFPEMLRTVRKGRGILKPLLACHNGSTAPSFYCFGHSHLDIAHLWPLRETESKCARTFATQLALMGEYKQMTFLQSQPYLYEVVKTKYPDLYRRIGRAVKQGRWIPEGGMWVEADTNIPGGESLIRQFIHGKRFFREAFGVDSRLLWLPDVFGYSGALPQIMLGCGVPYFSTMKLTWATGRHQPFPYHNFWWEGIDGSRVFAHIHNDYASSVDPATLIRRWETRRQRDGLTARLIPYGWGDGGGGPTREHLEYLKRQADLEGMPKVRHASPLEFFHDEEKRADWMPCYTGELYFQNHRGTYTSEAKTKNGNRRSEWALRETELWCSAAQALTGRPCPMETLDALWKRVLLNQFHDILPGSSIEPVFVEAEADYARVIDKAQELTAASTSRLVEADYRALTVFNSLSWKRAALVGLPAGFTGARTEAGDALPAQVVDGRTMVRVNELPACGWTTLYNDTPTFPQSALKVTRRRLENEVLRVRINDRGELTSLFDKQHQRELARGICNQFRMYKDVPFGFDAWNIDQPYRLCPVPLPGKARVTVTATGPLFAGLLIERTLNDSVLRQEIRLEAGSRKLDFVTEMDWREKHKLLKVSFPVDIHARDALHEIQFGHLPRPTHENTDLDAAQFEVCQHNWTALCENSHGVALLNNGKYGIDVTANVMSLTLLKSPLAPNMTADRGRQQFTYSFYMWNGPFASCDVVQKGCELNSPLTVARGRGGEISLLRVDQPNVIIETVKPAEDGSGDVVVRLYESMRMHTDTTLTVAWPVAQARATTMLEEGGRRLACRPGGRIPLRLTPFEIKTVRLEMRNKSNDERVLRHRNSP